jgi:hypothetical protein
MFPAFVEEMELGRYLKGILTAHAGHTVQIEPHCSGNVRSTHIFDVYLLGESFDR